MSLFTALLAPGHGRRQANREARLRAELLREQEAHAATLADLRHTASVLGEYVVVLGEEQTEHYLTREERDTAVRSNESNRNAETVKTDVSVLRAATADQFVEPDPPGPQYVAYERVASPVIPVMPLWDAPFAPAGAR